MTKVILSIALTFRFCLDRFLRPPGRTCSPAADAALAAYVNVESDTRVSGFEVALNNGSMAILPGQAVSADRRLYAPLVSAATGPGQEIDTIVKLVNSSDYYHNVNVTLALRDGSLVEITPPLLLAPRSSRELSLRRMLDASGRTPSGALVGGLYFESDQAGLVGYTRSVGSGSDLPGAGALPLQHVAIMESQLQPGSSYAFTHPSGAIDIVLMNPQESPVTVWLDLTNAPKGTSGSSQDAGAFKVSIPGWSMRLIELLPGALPLDGRIAVRSSAPVCASLY